MPPEAAALGSLRELGCMDNELRGLPVGPYLAGAQCGWVLGGGCQEPGTELLAGTAMPGPRKL